MDIDPLEATQQEKDERASTLNGWVAISVALIATFLAVCNVKDGNITQGMQQAQADKIDLYGWYQARNIREEVLSATSSQIHVAMLSASGAARAADDSESAAFAARAKDQDTKKNALKMQADAADSTYNALNYRDDQFDLSEALIAVSISLLAVTSLTQKRWLFWLAMLPTFFGVLMGLAGLLAWKIHPDTLIGWLT